MNELYCVRPSVTGPSTAVIRFVCHSTDCIHLMFCDTRHYVIVISEFGKHSPDFQLALSYFGAFIAYSTSSYDTIYLSHYSDMAVG